MDGQRFICSHCLSEMPATLYHRYSPNPMEQRFAGLFPFERATAFWFYERDSKLAMLIQDFKYRSMPKLAKYLGETVANQLFPTGWFDDIDIIVAVPMHWWKKAKRGYNQAEMIASGIAMQTGLSVSHDVKAVRPHRTQTALTLQERRKNTSGIFAIKDTKDLNKKHILVVDDVCTTGSTIANLAEMLHAELDGIRISILTLGVTF